VPAIFAPVLVIVRFGMEGLSVGDTLDGVMPVFWIVNPHVPTVGVIVTEPGLIPARS